MRLSDLHPVFLKYIDENHQRRVATLAEADGIMFRCPLCNDTNGHSVICWFVGHVPDDATPGPGRWTPGGTGVDNLTFVPGNPPRAISVFLNGAGGCGWHGFIRDGEATLS